jgi:hypothetical protein
MEKKLQTVSFCCTGLELVVESLDKDDTGGTHYEG